MSARRTSPRLVGAVVAALVAALSVLAAAPQAGASPPSSPEREVGVGSYNLFLGGNIGSLVDPQVDTVPEFIAAAAALWQNVVATDFPARAESIADLLAEDHPDVVGLQEVANWATTSLSGSPVPSYDFQKLLLDALAERGTPYRVIASNTNFASPTVPIPPLGLAVQFTDRDVVIARADLPASQLKAANKHEHTFQAGIPVTLPVGTTRIIRGWSTVDVKVRGKTFRFANTHLEAFNTAVRNAQAAELAESLAASPHPVVLVGDLNSQPTDAQGAYGLLTGTVGPDLADAWVEAPGTGDGDTSGQTDPLTNVPSLIDHRIDYVLYEPDPDSPQDPVIDATEAHVIGEELGDRATSTVTGTPRLLWPSDHAGVVATIGVGRPA
jgi:endonuclease/exonuclease/phosphatase family metal-dependent hydrolase